MEANAVERKDNDQERRVIRVVLESPYAGEIESNVKYAQKCLRDCIARGEAPIASHLLYPQVLDDSQPLERQYGIEAGLAWLEVAEMMVVYLDRGLSKGMAAAVNRAIKAEMMIDFRFLEGVNAYNKDSRTNAILNAQVGDGKALGLQRP